MEHQSDYDDIETAPGRAAAIHHDRPADDPGHVEQRAHARSPTAAPVTMIRVVRDQLWHEAPGQLGDVSASGIFLRTSLAVAGGRRVLLRVTLEDRVVVALGAVVRWDRGRHGCGICLLDAPAELEAALASRPPQAQGWEVFVL